MRIKKENLHIRDYIYLDVDRFKSILSQIEKGLIESKTETSGSSKEISGEGGLSIPAIIKAAGGAKFLLEDRTTETKTLHDHIYNYIEDELIKNKQLININESFSGEDWKNGKIHKYLSQTSFVLTKGHFLINDYEYMKNIFDKFNDIGEFIAYCGTLGTKNNIHRQEKTKEFHKVKKEMQLDKKFLNGFSIFFDTFYKDRLIIKVLPFKNFPNFRFVGNLQESLLRDKIQSILYKYGTSPSSEWTLFAQIASIPEKGYHPFSIDGMTGSEIEVAMQTMFSALREIESTGLSVTYPEISVTPIAIYRE